MQEVLNELDSLRLDCLDDDWVQAIYHSEFLEIADFPPEYESVVDSINITEVFHGIMNAIDTWIKSDNESDEGNTWASLSSNVKHQHLLTVLAFYIDYGIKNVHTKEYRNKALLASRVYYTLLSIPGFKAYHIYHAQLFTHTLTCLRFPQEMCEKDDNYYNAKELTRDVNDVIKKLRPYVVHLSSVVEKLQLQPTDMNFEDILSHLVDITGCAIVNKLNIDKIELAQVSQVIYLMIDTLLEDQSGEPHSAAIRLLFKCFLPKLVAASVDCKNANNLVRASYVTYTGVLLSKYGKAALDGFCILLQHLCYALDGLERAEVRAARVSLVMGLMSLLPSKSYRNIVKWLITLSTTAKISHRHIALELLASLLNNDADETVDELEPENVETLQQPSSELTSGQPPTESESQALNETVSDGELQTSVVDDESSQDSQNVADTDGEERCGALSTRRPRAPHACLLRGVAARVLDAASSLRARALLVLADCVQARAGPVTEALLRLEEAEPTLLVSAASRALGDERAVVRRAAVALLHRLMATRHAALTDTNLGMVVNVCRDASIIVRSGAISCIGELATHWATADVMHAFLSGPLHQLSDPETKIQEQVTSLVQQILIDRLGKFSSSGCDDQLPWIFLECITKYNMRRHLQKACAMLAKSTTCISERVVDACSTHLGALSDARDLHCLVLLTSVARHVPCEELAFLLAYFYSILDELQNHDGRILPLTIELLTEWSDYLTATERADLRNKLITTQYPPDGCRIACYALAGNLDPDNLQWATELMHIYERRALSGGCVEEWLSAADMSLVSPHPPSPRLLQLFIDALDNPPLDEESSLRGRVVAGAGRLCVRWRSAAERTAAGLARALRAHAEPQCARLNALRALTDICTRYTCIVEPLLESVCECLSVETPSELRAAASSALTRLLLAGYLRLRTPLYYRYCALLADEDADVREPAEYYVTSCLTADTIYHHFVECVLHYNKDNTEVITFDARQLIYDVMLQRMSLVQKLNIQCRLATEVLQHAADMCDEGAPGAVADLEPALSDALLDTITLLCGPRMKLPRKPQNSGDADIDDLQERVTTNIVSHKMKRTVAEVLVPAVLRLYSRMRTKGGQLNVYLVRIATDLLKDYRQEIEELIDNDEELVERVRLFQETIGEEPSFGNSRNLVTTSSTHEPETPRSTRRRPNARPASARGPPPKRTLRI